jgi:hypothetical protein
MIIIHHNVCNPRCVPAYCPSLPHQLAQVEVVNKGLTKGEASDMISGVFVAMASPQQLQQLKVRRPTVCIWSSIVTGRLSCWPARPQVSAHTLAAGASLGDDSAAQPVD